METIVTVGICARNCENTLSKALDSIIAQDFPHDKMQIIIVDDGSEDHTLQIIQEYAHKMDIKIKVFQTNWQGLSRSRNLITENADGKYIIWVDADEILTPSYIRKQVEFMEANPHVGITAGILGLVQGNLVLNLELIPYIISHLYFDQPKSFLWKTEKLLGTGGSTFRVKALKQVNGFNNKLKGAGEDVEVAHRIRKAGWLIRPNDALFYELFGGLSNFTDLWNKYSWRGFGCEQIYRENREIFSLPRMSPIAGIITGLFYSFMGYQLLRQKQVFLLPIHYGIKMTFWSFGFIKGQLRRLLIGNK